MLGPRWIVVVCAVALVACGKKKGTQIESTDGSAALEVTRETETAGLVVSIAPGAQLPVALERYATAFGKYMRVVKVVDIAPGTAVFAGPATLTVTFTPAELPGGVTEPVMAVEATADGELADLTVEKAGDGVTMKLARPGSVLLGFGPRDVQLLGTPALAVRGSSRVLLAGDCPSWIAAEAPRVAELAKAAKGGDPMAVPAALAVRPYAPADDMLPADEVVARGGGDPINLSIVWGSVASALGRPVRLVAGEAAFERDGKKRAGFHQWAEELIDGKPYVIDSLDAKGPRVVSSSEAYAAYHLVAHRTCSRYPKGGAPTDGDWTLVPAHTPGSLPE